MKPNVITAILMGSFEPQETKHFPRGKIDLFDIEGNTFSRLTLQPGWRWACLKPLEGTESCRFSNFHNQVSGTLCCRMKGGFQIESRVGDISYLTSGHDAWVVGDEPVIAVDYLGRGNE